MREPLDISRSHCLNMELKKKNPGITEDILCIIILIIIIKKMLKVKSLLSVLLLL